MESVTDGLLHRDDGNRQLENVEQTADKVHENINDSDYPNPQLPKIHTKHHSVGKYKMFSNYSSAKHVPWTSTGA